MQNPEIDAILHRCCADFNNDGFAAVEDAGEGATPVPIPSYAGFAVVRAELDELPAHGLGSLQRRLELASRRPGAAFAAVDEGEIASVVLRIPRSAHYATPTMRASR